MNKAFLAIQMPGWGELLVILAIVLILFGAAKIPEIARSIAEGIREFKKASRDDSDPKENEKKQ